MGVYYVCFPWYLDSGIPAGMRRFFFSKLINRIISLSLGKMTRVAKSMSNPLNYTLILFRREMGLIQSFLN
jgi:hypothetical protein